MKNIFYFIFSTSLFADPIKVTVISQPPGLWNKAEESYIQKAAELTFQRIVTSEVANCAHRNSFRDKYSKDELRRKWGEQIPVLNKGRQVTLTVRKEKLERKILGQAKVGGAQVDRNNYSVLGLDISLNEDLLNQNVKEYANKNHVDAKLNQWISVIAHEIGHNFGYNHGAAGTWTTDYPGFFVTELGFCTMTEGRYGSDLGDMNLRREITAKFGGKK